MTWLEQWRALAARIDGLVRAGEFFVSALKVHSTDELQVVKKALSPELTAISEAVKELGAKNTAANFRQTPVRHSKDTGHKIGMNK